jgi:hypothetical protein
MTMPKVDGNFYLKLMAALPKADGSSKGSMAIPIATSRIRVD